MALLRRLLADIDRSSVTMLLCAAGLVVLLVVVEPVLSVMPRPIGPAAHLFASGAVVTVELTLIAGVIGLVLGIAAGVGKVSKATAVRSVCTFYVWIFRGTPLLTQILFCYFALPVLLPQLQLNEFTSAALALTLNVGAYNAEAFRAGLLGVPKGQTQAGLALGLSSWQLFRLIVLPQAIRIATPALASNKVALLKDSSLAYGIGVVELNMVANRVQSESFQPLPVFIAVAMIYLLLTTVFTQFSAALERRAARHA